MNNDYVSVSEIVELLLTSEKWSFETLAIELDVSVSAISRWKLGKSKPKAEIEGKLRALVSSISEARVRYTAARSDLSYAIHYDIATALDNALSQLREIFHRHGRISGRKEGLEEVSKLLFAHVTSLANEGYGIDNRLINSKNIALNLSDFVKSSYEKYLPESLSHEIDSKSFHLRLQPQESQLAYEIVQCFDTLSNTPGLVSEHGIECVDILNEVFGKFLSDSFIDEKQLGQYLTPTEVVRFMVNVAIDSLSNDELNQLYGDDPSAFGYVLDPSCGVASFLAEFIRALHTKSTLSKSSEKKWLNNVIRSVVIGLDKSEQMVRLALSNIAMFGIPATNIHLTNSLSNDKSSITNELHGKVGLILTNPPFGAEYSKSDLSGSWLAEQSKGKNRISSECLFLERYLDWLRPGGQLLAIVPDSILTNQGTFAELRKHISGNSEILGVISLPKETFATSGTTTKTSILHLRKFSSAKQKLSHNIFFAQVNNIGYTVSVRNSQRVKKSTGSNDLQKILFARRNGASSESNTKVAYEIAANRWDAAYHLWSKSEKNKGLKVSDVANLANRRHDPRRKGIPFQYIEISDLDNISLMCRSKICTPQDAPSRARKFVKEGDVLVSTVRPERKAVAIVENNLDGATCTTGLAILEPKSIHPFVLASLLKDEFCVTQIMRNNVGIAYPVIDENCLLDVELPITLDDLSELAQKAQEITKLQEKTRELNTEFAALIDLLTKKFKEDPTPL